MRPLTRRAFLTTGGTAALTLVALKTTGVGGTTKGVAGSARGLGVNGTAARLGSTAAPFTISAFQPHVGTVFRLQAGARNVDLNLTTVQQLAQRSSKGGAVAGQQFSLLFEGLAGALRQETYPLEHGVLGHFALFIVPVGLAQGSVQAYEAIVNDARA